MSNINISQTSTEDFKIGTLMNVEAIDDSLTLKSSVVKKNIVGENRKKIPLIANYMKGKGSISFTVKRDTVISSLGFYNTWDSSYTSVVSLFDLNSNLLASTTVFASHSAMSSFSDIAPVTLLAGETYKLECTHNKRTSFIPQSEYTSYVNFDNERFDLISHESNLSGFVTALPFMREKLLEYPIFGYRQFTINISDAVNIGDSVVSWNETAPDGTNVIIEALNNDNAWKQLINGGPLPNIKDLSSVSIRQNLVTSNNTISPRLNEFSLFIDDKEFATYKTELKISESHINNFSKVFNSDSLIEIKSKDHLDRRFKVYGDSLIGINSINNNYFNKNIQSSGDITIFDSSLADVNGIEIEINYVETFDEDFDEGILINVESNGDTLELSKEDYYLPNVLKTHQTISSIKPIPGTKSGLIVTDAGWEFTLLDDIYIKNLKWYNTHDIKLTSLITIWDVASNSVVIQQEVSAHNGWGILNLDEPYLLIGNRKYIISVRKNKGEPYLSIPLNDVQFVPYNNVEFIKGRTVSVQDNSVSALYPVDNTKAVNRLPSFDFYLASNKISTGYALKGYRISREIDLSKIEYIVASEISWNSIGDVEIETSVDRGLTWQKAVNGRPIKNLVGFGENRFLLIREILSTISRKETPYLYDLSVNISDKPYPHYKLFENPFIDINVNSTNHFNKFIDQKEDVVLTSKSDIVIHKYIMNSYDLTISSNGVIKHPLLVSNSEVEIDVNDSNFFNKYFIHKSEVKINTGNNSPKTISLFNKSKVVINSDQEKIDNRFIENNSSPLVDISSRNHIQRNISHYNELSFSDHTIVVVDKNVQSINNISINSNNESIKNLYSQNVSPVLVDVTSKNLNDKLVENISKLSVQDKSDTVMKVYLSSSSNINIDVKISRMLFLRNNSNVVVKSISNNLVKREVLYENRVIINSANNVVTDRYSQENSTVDFNVLSNNSFNKLLSSDSKLEVDTFNQHNGLLIRENSSELSINSSTYQPKIKKIFEKSSLELDSVVLVDHGYNVDISGTRTLTLPKNIPSGIEFKVGAKKLQVDSVKVFANSTGREYPVMIWDVDTKETIWIQMVSSTSSNTWTKVALDNPVILKPNKHYVLSTIAYEGLAEREIKSSNISPNSELLEIVNFRQGDPEYVDYFPETYVGQSVEIYAAVDIEYSRVVYSSPKVVTDVISLNEMHTILNSKAEWAENLPLGTSILIESSNDNGDTWQKAINGGIIIPSATLVSGKELFVKQTLTSENEDLTPTLNNLKIELNN